MHPKSISKLIRIEYVNERRNEGTERERETNTNPKQMHAVANATHPRTHKHTTAFTLKWWINERHGWSLLTSKCICSAAVCSTACCVTFCACTLTTISICKCSVWHKIEQNNEPANEHIYSFSLTRIRLCNHDCHPVCSWIMFVLDPFGCLKSPKRYAAPFVTSVYQRFVCKCVANAAFSLCAFGFSHRKNEPTTLSHGVSTNKNEQQNTDR